MPHISVHYMKDDDIEKKRKLVKKLTDSMVEVYGVPREAVTVEIWEISMDNVAHGGELISDRRRQAGQ